MMVVCATLFDEKVSSDIFTNRKLYLGSQLRHLLPDLVHPHDDLLPEKVAVHTDHAQPH